MGKNQPNEPAAQCHVWEYETGADLVHQHHHHYERAGESRRGLLQSHRYEFIRPGRQFQRDFWCNRTTRSTRPCGSNWPYRSAWTPRRYWSTRPRRTARTRPPNRTSRPFRTGNRSGSRCCTGMPRLEPVSFGTGANPAGIAFDGASMWIVNSGANSVTRMQRRRYIDGHVPRGNEPARCGLRRENAG